MRPTCGSTACCCSPFGGTRPKRKQHRRTQQPKPNTGSSEDKSVHIVGTEFQVLPMSAVIKVTVTPSAVWAQAAGTSLSSLVRRVLGSLCGYFLGLINVIM